MIKVTLTYGGTTVELPEDAARNLIREGNARMAGHYSADEHTAITEALKQRAMRREARETVISANGAIVAAGPNGEADFTDSRYWVQAGNAAPVIVVNVSEAEADTHLLPVGTPVQYEPNGEPFVMLVSTQGLPLAVETIDPPAEEAESPSSDAGDVLADI